MPLCAILRCRPAAAGGGGGGGGGLVERDLSKIDDPFGGRNRGGAERPIKPARNAKAPASDAAEQPPAAAAAAPAPEEAPSEEPEAGAEDEAGMNAGGGGGGGGPEPLSAAARKSAEPMIAVFGEYRIQCLYSKQVLSHRVVHRARQTLIYVCVVCCVV